MYKQKKVITPPRLDETGRIGYLIAWLLGVPAWLLFMVFLVRGH
jgi:hypothetical protein